MNNKLAKSSFARTTAERELCVVFRLICAARARYKYFIKRSSQVAAGRTRARPLTHTRAHAHARTHALIHHALARTRGGSLRTVAGSIRKSTVPVRFNVYTYIHHGSPWPRRRPGPLDAHASTSHRRHYTASIIIIIHVIL